jgi:D-threo-aldose 1-dehydrogenase
MTPTQIGFGCASLMRLQSRKDRLNLLAATYDSGIRYFDVARMYGLGQSEGELGRFLAGRRDQVVVATKFGINPHLGVQKMGFLQPAARVALDIFPSLKKIVTRRAGKLYEVSRYDVATGYVSLEQSLEQLGTDYVDLFLLHEPTVEEVNDSNLEAWLESLKADGKIRAFGVAGEIGFTKPFLSRFPALTQVVQFDNDAVRRQIEQVDIGSGRNVITFSPFSRAFSEIWGYLDKDRSAQKKWSSCVGYDFRKQDTIIRFLLAYAIRANPRGVVLFSTTKPKRVLEIMRWIDEGLVDDESLKIFLDLVGIVFDRREGFL